MNSTIIFVIKKLCVNTEDCDNAYDFFLILSFILNIKIYKISLSPSMKSLDNNPCLPMFSVRYASEIKKDLCPESTILRSAYSYVHQTHLSILLTDHESLLAEWFSKDSNKFCHLLISTTQLLDIYLVPRLITLLSKTHLWILPLHFIEHYELIAEYWDSLITAPEPQDMLISSKNDIKRSNRTKPLFDLSTPAFSGKKVENIEKIIMNMHIFKLTSNNWKQIHYWEDLHGSFIICVSGNGSFRWISLNSFKEELMLQLKLDIKETHMVQAGFLRESYLLLSDTNGKHWKMWLSTKEVKSILQSNVNAKAESESDILNVLSGYKVLSVQHIKYNMCGVIAYKDSQIHLFDCSNLDMPIVSYQLFLESPIKNFSVGIIGKYLLIQEKNKIKVHSQNLLMGSICKSPSKVSYCDWLFKDYSNLDSLFQVLSLEKYGEVVFEKVVYNEVEDIEKLFAQSEPKALASTMIRFFTSHGFIEVGMTPMTLATVKDALISVQTPYQLRQIEIFLQAAGYPLNDCLAKLSDTLLAEKQTKLAFRYAVLAEKDPIQVLSEYLQFEVLYEDMYRWLTQLLTFEKYIDQSRLEQYLLVLAYILVKVNRTDIAPYIRFSEFKKIFKKPKYLDYSKFILESEQNVQKKLVSEEGIKKVQWVLSLARILLSTGLEKLTQEKEKLLLSGLNKLIFENNSLGLSSTKLESSSKLEPITDVVTLQKEIMNTQALAAKPVKYYAKIIPWIRERLLGYKLHPYRQVELYIIKGLLTSTEPNIYYQLKHKEQFYSSFDFHSFLRVLHQMSLFDILQLIKTVTFNYHLFYPSKPLINVARADQFFSNNSGLLFSLLHSSSTSVNVFNYTAVNFAQVTKSTTTKNIETLKKIRSNLAISYNALKAKHASYFSAFLTPYVCALILLTSKSVHPVSLMEYQFIKLLPLLLSRFNTAIDMRLITKLLIETKQWQIVRKIATDNHAWVDSLQAAYLGESLEEVATLAVGFLASPKPVEFYIFLLNFLKENSVDIKDNFEARLLLVCFWLYNGIMDQQPTIGSKARSSGQKCIDKLVGTQCPNERTFNQGHRPISILFITVLHIRIMQNQIKNL
eukprot:TRINITY_DN165_c1_g1_i1.p1 TRINITY_DN165_c1_g1~~TRINITY_DN165_c1_g1_i1.p1  ORF type:complete len:1087 (+),score=71.83 TRINITY_DN165_c1_g1_i1:1806-5066(+)